MQATKVLEAQHRAIEKLFSKILGSREDEVALVEELGRHVLTHMIVEQTILYPAIFSLDEDFVLESVEEHAVSRFQLRRLLGTTAEGSRLQAKVRALKGLVTRHMKGEEQILFPRIAGALEGRKGEELAERLLVASEELFTKDLDVLLLRSKKAGSTDATHEVAA